MSVTETGVTLCTHYDHLTTHTKSVSFEMIYDYNQCNFKGTHQYSPKLQTKAVHEGENMNPISVTVIK